MKIRTDRIADYFWIESDDGRRMMGKDGLWKGARKVTIGELAKFATPNQAMEFWEKRDRRDIYVSNRAPDWSRNAVKT
jgi:hypothetical protein